MFRGCLVSWTTCPLGLSKELLPFKLQFVVWNGFQTLSALSFGSFPTEERKIFPTPVASLGSPTITLKFAAVSRLPLKSSTAGFKNFCGSKKPLMQPTCPNIPRHFHSYRPTCIPPVTLNLVSLCDKQF